MSWQAAKPSIDTDCWSHGLYGFAYFPDSFEETNSMHGVVNDIQSVTGGGICGEAPCEGDTAKHEIGHYLGLYHTFQDGCDFANDMVSDTPSTDRPNYGTCGDPNNPSDDPAEIETYCPDTCGDGDGCDMQWNYMVCEPSTPLAPALPFPREPSLSFFFFNEVR